MLDGEVNLLVGCRAIYRLQDEIDFPKNKAFALIEAIESETDHFPLGEMRIHCAPDYLERIDGEMERYLADAKEDILEACREIIRLFKK